MQTPSLSRKTDTEFAHETRIRSLYAERLLDYRPRERLLKNEHGYQGTNIRGDMKTVDSANVLRIWEFEIFASYEGLGQVLTYLAMARLETGFDRKVEGVLAAFEFQPEIVKTVEVLNLGIELVALPAPIRMAGLVPGQLPPMTVPYIPDHSDDGVTLVPEDQERRK